MADAAENTTPIDDVQIDQDELENGGEVDAMALMLPEASEEQPKSYFLDYIRSPIIQLLVGPEKESIPVHQAYLEKSPWFSEACTSLDSASRTIELPDDTMETVGAVLEYLYTNEYFPRRFGDSLEEDSRYPTPDPVGEGLLRHARIYTLANKLQLPALKSMAHAKIHRTTSTARGELAFAKYVYATTSLDDEKIRTPIAAFWATRSHKLRHEAEDEFRAMCMEYPQFGFDVLTRVLDQREFGSQPSINVKTPGTAKGKKRLRMSSS